VRIVTQGCGLSRGRDEDGERNLCPIMGSSLLGAKKILPYGFILSSARVRWAATINNFK
jgi:hypothetical protein